jgi:L-fucose isomerase-like protein
MGHGVPDFAGPFSLLCGGLYSERPVAFADVDVDRMTELAVAVIVTRPRPCGCPAIVAR